jgi:hypothetical protein
MNKFIVTTTINPPTDALIAFSRMPGWKLIVVGDKKTPDDSYQDINCEYLSPHDQEKQFPQLSDLIGWNCVQRRNLGFLKALEQGAEIVATVDDDNIPLENWGKNLIVGKTIEIKSFSTDKVFDPLSVTNYSHLWHRGFPIQRLASRISNESVEKITIDVEASFWNGDPDVDAICRMEHAPSCKFDPDLFPFTSPQFSPFDSQNTFLTRKALKSYFMFPGIGRMDDIWGSYFLESLGFRVAYTAASVRQDRNVHDLTIDFNGEIIGYQKTDTLLDALIESPSLIAKFVGERSFSAFEKYQQIVEDFD